MAGGTGAAVDSMGAAVLDPSINVKALNEAGLKRGDDILNLNMSWMDKYTAKIEQRQDDLRDKDADHFRELLKIQETHFVNLMTTETKRLNDIRAVDVAGVAEAAKVVAAGQLALANALTVTNDATRLANQTLASSISDNLATTIKPIVDGLAEVQKRQYETAGAKSQSVEGRITQGQVFGYIFGAAGVIFAAIALYLRTTGK